VPEKFESKEEYLIYLCHLFAYEFAEEKVPPNCRVLEVGSGEGYGTNKLSKSNKVKEIIGLDVDFNSIKKASNKYKSSRLSFRHYNGKTFPFKENCFDVVISFQVIEHIQDDINYLHEVYRVLKKNGIFILTTPNRTYRLKPGQKPWNRFHVREYDSKTLKKVLACRFENAEILGVRGNDEVQKIEIERVRKNLQLISLDPLNLRKLVPESMKPFIIKILRGLVTKKDSKSENFLSRYNTKQYYVIKDNLDNSIDLLGVCKKN